MLFKQLLKSFAFLIAVFLLSPYGTPSNLAQATKGEELVDLINYYPIGPGHGNQMVILSTNESLTSSSQSFAEKDKEGIYACEEMNGDLLTTKYYMVRPTGIYCSARKDTLVEDPSCLFLPAKVKQGEAWTIKSGADFLAGSLEGRLHTFLGVQGDYVSIRLIPPKEHLGWTTRWILMRNYGLVGLYWMGRGPTPEEPIVCIGVNRKFLLDHIGVERKAP